MTVTQRATGRHWAAEPPRRTMGVPEKWSTIAPKTGRWSVFARRTVASAAALMALTATWEASKFLPDFSTGGGIFGPKSLNGDTNILLIGLDSRKDQDGSDLSDSVLAKLHAGDGQEGGYNTNTLILIHIPGHGGKAIAFSIPRDDYVSVRGIKGYSKIKIKEAYGLKKWEVENELVNEGVSDRKILERRGHEAGRQETIRTVRELLGVPIDQYAEVNLVGFYDVAKAIGGVDVCLNHAVYDEDYSGANFPKGHQHLNAAQALAFVRQRHGLDNGDLDRTHRQQAFLASVEHELSSSGAISDLDKLRALVTVAQKDVVLSPGWDVIDFIQKVEQSTKGEVEFRTLPVERYDTINDQDVNIIDPKKVAAEVQQAFSGSPQPPARASSSTTTASPTSRSSGSALTSPAAATQDPDAPDQGKPVESGGVPCVN